MDCCNVVTDRFAEVVPINPLLHLSIYPFLASLWCSPANMPASHAGDHRSEAGQGRHFRIGLVDYWIAGLMGSRRRVPPNNPFIHHPLIHFRLPGAWFAGNSRPT